ncbi:MAG: GNAT family N-acetyltransferase [Bacteroidota bacterium]|nr:GNAT family N-acetyltransferase [Bacteroidota bacterium]
MKDEVEIRKAFNDDMPAIWKLIRELAIYEKAEEEHSCSVDQLTNDFINERFQCTVATSYGTIVGMALYYYSYSTWKGKCVYLEDLIISKQYRNKGIGSALLENLIDIAKINYCHRLSWQVLDWNQPAIQFYNKWKAELDSEWINCKMRFNYEEINEGI